MSAQSTGSGEATYTLKTIREKPVELTHCLHYLWIRPLKQHGTQEIAIIPVAASWEQVNSSLHGLKA